MAELILLQFLVAACMMLGALCLLFWAIRSGQFEDVEKPKYRAYWAEVKEHEHKEKEREQQ
jgi:cbb3-type cytochrome oxidase maturation protein